MKHDYNNFIEIPFIFPMARFPYLMKKAAKLHHEYQKRLLQATVSLGLLIPQDVVSQRTTGEPLESLHVLGRINHIGLLSSYS